METVHKYRTLDGTEGKILCDRKNRKVYLVEGQKRIEGTEAILRLNKIIAEHSDQLMEAKKAVEAYAKILRTL